MRDYAELVERLRYCADRPICFSTQCDYRQTAHIGACFDSLKHDAADAIEELLDELTTIRKQLPHWISVEDELPHYLDHVLCVNKYGIQMVGYLTDYKEGGFRCESGMDSCDYITHWMPLPTPPKGVE